VTDLNHRLSLKDLWHGRKVHEPGGIGQPNVHQNTIFLALPTKGPSDEAQSAETFEGALAAPATARCPEPTVVPTPTPPQSAGMPRAATSTLARSSPPSGVRISDISRASGSGPP